MILEDKKCIFCNSDDVETFPSKLAPFIKDRINTDKDEIFNFIRCKNCGAAFYDYRYSEDEIKLIYKNYRDEAYQKTRQKYENWYTDEINKNLGDNSKTLVERKTNLLRILKKYTNIDEIKTVLDFGGDKGQFIPEELKASKYVYDISCKETVNGVVPIRELKDCYANSPSGYDLIICANVLEHLADPFETARILKSLLSKNGYLQVEVPFDSPFYKTLEDYIPYLFNKYFKLTDLVKEFFKRKNAKYCLEHEHINFYTVSAMKALLDRSGFEIIQSEIHKTYSVIGFSKNIHVLCRQKNDN